MRFSCFPVLHAITHHKVVTLLPYFQDKSARVSASSTATSFNLLYMSHKMLLRSFWGTARSLLLLCWYILSLGALWCGTRCMLCVVPSLELSDLLCCWSLHILQKVGKCFIWVLAQCGVWSVCYAVVPDMNVVLKGLYRVCQCQCVPGLRLWCDACALGEVCPSWAVW